MKFFVAGKFGAIVILDDGSIRVCSSVRQQRALLNRIALNPHEWKNEMVECVNCKAYWCEIHRKTQHAVECPDCKSVLII